MVTLRERHAIANVAFLQQNLFRPAFRPEVSDVVIANGVLHHTSDPGAGFRTLVGLLEPGGHVLVGLYNRLGHLTTDLRRVVFRLTRDRLLKGGPEGGFFIVIGRKRPSAVVPTERERAAWHS